MNTSPHPRRLIQWFDPRHRHPGTWAFILNRITALGLTLYLVMHLFMLGKLIQGPDAYDSFIRLAKTPVVMIGEFLVLVAGLFHALNGVRIFLTTLGIGVRSQKSFFAVIVILTLAGSLFFAWKMISGA